MVPLYSFESWLAMRFHKQAIYIETLRDFYESYVLYSFLQFLIQVLGGEENLIHMLKDKSPTRGVHMWGLQWCVKPWLMGQPLRRAIPNSPTTSNLHLLPIINSGSEGHENSLADESSDEGNITLLLKPGTSDSTVPSPTNSGGLVSGRTIRKGKSRIHHKNNKQIRKLKQRKPPVIWTSPFFLNCKFGVLQYVLLKLVCAVAVLLLEWKGWYREGHFDWQSGYLYICILTNMSQCWALYSLIFFYYATKTELSPIRPVGKFLSVKALVFFTWWQSVFISVLYQMDMIPTYRKDWTSEDVAKGIQDYLICVEMFVAAVVHAFVFPHSEYSQAAVDARLRAVDSANSTAFHSDERSGKRRLGRQRIHGHNYYTKFWKENYLDDGGSKNSNTNVDPTTFSAEDGASIESQAESSRIGNNTSFQASLDRFTKSVTPNLLSSQDHPDFFHRNNTSTQKVSNTFSNKRRQDLNLSNPSRLASLPIVATSVIEQPQQRSSEHNFYVQSQWPVHASSAGNDDCDITKMFRNDETFHQNFGKNEDGSLQYLNNSEYEDPYISEEYGSESNDFTDSNDFEEDDSSASYPNQQRRAPASGSDVNASSRPGFVRALLDSAIPRDLGQNTVAIVTGEYHVEKKTLLHHAATSDQYDLFSNRRRVARQHQQQTSKVSVPEQTT